MKRSVGVLANALCASLLGLSGPSMAAVVTGNLNLTGAVQFSSSLIDFTPSFGGSGVARVVDGSIGTFATLINSSAFIKDISLPPPGGGVINAITFENDPQLHFDALSTGPGAFSPAACGAAPAAPGQTCTPPGTTFNFANTVQGSTVSFEVSGNFANETAGLDPTPYRGLFTAQFIGSSFQQVLAAIAGGATITTSYSVSFAPSPVPEPALAFTLAAGLLAVASLRRFVRSA